MTLYAVWPYLAILAGVLLLLRPDCVFGRIDGPVTSGTRRFATIDGLRGFLAFGVFGHHAVVMHEYLRTGVWAYPPSDFYVLLGEGAVMLFFAITGFLFWAKLLQVRGAPDWRGLYVGRFFRIAPVYLVAAAIVLAVEGTRTGFELREPPLTVLFDGVRWLALGIAGQPGFNGNPDTGRLLAGVTWTLRYEWAFYFSLPLLAVFAKRRWHLPFALVGLVACLGLFIWEGARSALLTSLFFCGMLSASLLHEGYRIRRAWAGFAIGAASLVCLFTAFPTADGVGQVLLMGMLFHVLGSGNSFLGVLTLKPVRRLGEISYSVYLTHGLVLSGVFSIAAVRSFAFASDVHYWLIVAVCAVLVVTAASLIYVFIERPGIDLGKQLAGRTVASRTPGTPA